MVTAWPVGVVAWIETLRVPKRVLGMLPTKLLVASSYAKLSTSWPRLSTTLTPATKSPTGTSVEKSILTSVPCSSKNVAIVADADALLVVRVAVLLRKAVLVAACDELLCEPRTLISRRRVLVAPPADVYTRATRYSPRADTGGYPDRTELPRPSHVVPTLTSNETSTNAEIDVSVEPEGR